MLLNMYIKRRAPRSIHNCHPDFSMVPPHYSEKGKTNIYTFPYSHFLYFICIICQVMKKTQPYSLTFFFISKELININGTLKGCPKTLIYKRYNNKSTWA